MADVMQRLRASAASPVATPAPAAAPAVAGAAPPPQGVTGPVPAPATGDPGVATGVESGNRQFAQGDTPLIPPQFKGGPDEWNAPVGVTQVRPSTAFQYIPTVDFLRLQSDEGYNKQVGNAVHGMLFRQYAGNKMLADAAYYAGAGTVDRLLKQVGDPRAGKISNEDFAAHLPPQTQQYVHATGAVSGVPGNQGGAGVPEMPFPPANIFHDMQQDMFGAKGEASEDLKGVRAALDKLAEPPPQVQQTPPSQVWGSAAMAIAALGGLLTHTPVTTALNAAAGVADAFNQGDRVRAKDQFERWKAANDATLKTTQLRIGLYQDAMKRYAQAPQTAMAELSANAAALNDQMMMKLASDGDVQGALAYASGGAEAYYKLKLTSLQYERATQVQLAAQDLQAARVRGDQPEVIADKEQAYQMALQLASPAGTVLKIENPTGTQQDAADRKTVADANIAAKRQELGRDLTDAEKAQTRLDVGVDQKGAAAAAAASGRQSAGPAPGSTAATQVNTENALRVAHPEWGKDKVSQEATRQIAAIKLAAGSVPQTDDDKTSAAAQAATGQPLTEVVPGWGPAAVGARSEARSGAIKKIMADTGASAADAGVELANRTIEYQSGKRSAVQLTTMLGATRQAVSQLDFNIQQTKQEMAKLGSSDVSPVVNAIARGEERWTGEPAYSSLFYYMHATALESARILSGGQASIAQLQQGAMDEAKQWASINMTPASFDAVSNAMRAEGENRIKTYETAIQGQRVGDGGTASPRGGGSAAAYISAADVKQAFHDGKISKDDATRILRDRFGYE